MQQENTKPRFRRKPSSSLNRLHARLGGCQLRVDAGDVGRVYWRSFHDDRQEPGVGSVLSKEK